MVGKVKLNVTYPGMTVKAGCMGVEFIPCKPLYSRCGGFLLSILPRVFWFTQAILRLTAPLLLAR